MFWLFLQLLSEKFSGAIAKLRKLAISFVMSVSLSVCMEQFGSQWTDFHENLYLDNFRNSVKNTEFSSKSDKNNVYFTWRPIHIFIISLWILRRMRNVSDKSGRENQQYVLYSVTFLFFPFENRALYEIMWKNTVQPDRPQMTIWRMRIARWVLKATKAHS